MVSLLQCDKELKVSLFQAIVLLLFNNQPSWTAADIMMATKLGKGLRSASGAGELDDRLCIFLFRAKRVRTHDGIVIMCESPCASQDTNE
ncbi:hypothetical protein Y032_0025g1164 [Ancylostoma ceylanicum]|uniref:Uncharacterized protein n=1 Tax=Ancylostoma ceylanicum TaxID=53326 RepID=A0A016UWH3_9BILA|nr:hypothetical protein Y032_0025g1164 [Ancylostoma ceylanicum]